MAELDNTLRGLFIVLEGLDRSGKSTQTELLGKKFKNTRGVVQLLKFPDRTTHIGQMIDAYLRSQGDIDDQAIHLLFSANRWELAAKIRALLESGISIVCDRYAFSGIAFSAAKHPVASSIDGDQAPLSYQWCKSPDTGLPAPDITFFLDITPEKARERGGYGEERYEKEETQIKVRHVFETIAADVGSKKWIAIDAARDPAAVHQDIWDKVQLLLEGGSDIGPIQQLWL